MACACDIVPGAIGCIILLPAERGWCDLNRRTGTAQAGGKAPALLSSWCVARVRRILAVCVCVWRHLCNRAMAFHASRPPNSASLCGGYSDCKVRWLPSCADRVRRCIRTPCAVVCYLNPDTDQVVIVAEDAHSMVDFQSTSAPHGMHFDVYHDDDWRARCQRPQAARPLALLDSCSTRVSKLCGSARSFLRSGQHQVTT